MDGVHRVRSAGILIGAGCVLVQQMIGDDFWALPGGAVEAGESPEDALRREFVEELGVEIGVVRLAYIVDNRFRYRGQVYNEIGRYYLVTCEALTVAPQAVTSLEPDLRFAWSPLSGLAAHHLRPAVLADRLDQVPAEPAFLRQELHAESLDGPAP